ncbi:hypothetical protein BU23DRAFT_626400 [Bimuria novae-zelandiae CBS 107.79]|uniref:C2H2-type domain-containing protein n=1 Tax=Bimuria novae-zelandiae CBS 107.79 TaxID=1447943 RepID=A0A6A5VUE4_9PLEO|nr:hypothetical protein BU23DRAFT_626400 [Bimuria novae-zelandiae CBS 107.79]
MEGSLSPSSFTRTRRETSAVSSTDLPHWEAFDPSAPSSFFDSSKNGSVVPSASEYTGQSRDSSRFVNSAHSARFPTSPLSNNSNSGAQDGFSLSPQDSAHAGADGFGYFSPYYMNGAASDDFLSPMNYDLQSSSSSSFYPAISRYGSPSHLPATISGPSPMSDTVQSESWSTQRRIVPSPRPPMPPFPCPVREAERDQKSQHGADLNYSCTGIAVENMAEVRRHVQRAHRPEFLKLCPTCNEHSVDEAAYMKEHGKKGEKCENPRKQPRGTATEAEWMKLRAMDSPTRDNRLLSTTASIPALETPHASKSAVTPENRLTANVPSGEPTGWLSFGHGGSGSDPNWGNQISANSHVPVGFPSSSLFRSVPSAYSVPTPVQNLQLLHQEYPTGSQQQLRQEPSWTMRGLSTRYASPPNTKYQQRRSIVCSMESTDAADPGPAICDDCGRVFTGEYRRGNRARHRRQKHGDTEDMYDCKDPGCEASFKRQDARLKHYRKHHRELAPSDPTPRKL